MVESKKERIAESVMSVNASGKSDGNKKNQRLLTLTKKVLINAVGYSLDYGGNIVCGPTWPLFKQILEPVVSEIKKDFPQVFASGQEAEKAAIALSENDELIEMLSSKFDSLWAGQQEIMTTLMRQGGTLDDIKDTVDKASRTQLSRLEHLEIKLDKVLLDLLAIPSSPELSLEDIKSQAPALQEDAERWLSSGKLDVAQARLIEARRLIRIGIDKNHNDTFLIALRGYVEKTQSNIYSAENELDSAIAAFDEAIKYFASALKIDPKEANALNGMVDVYIYVQDYDRAIELGRAVVKENPEYIYAIWDLTLAIREKLKQSGDKSKLMQELADLYLRLLYLIPAKPNLFSPGQFKEIQCGLDDLKEKGYPPKQIENH